MKANWQSKPIGDVFKLVNGGTPKTGVASNWDGPHAWITPAEMGNLETPFISESRRTLTDEGLRTGAELVPAGSIILSSRAPIGHLVINEIPMAFNQGCKGLIPSPAIDTKFAYYFLLTNVPLLESLGTGATFKELSGGKLKEVLFQFPELGEQRHIVTLLDEAFADIATAKANAEKNLQNAREIFESQLQFIFKDEGREWPVMPLEKVASIVNGFAFKSGDFTPSGETKCIKITNVGVREFVCESDGRLPKQFSSKFTSVAIPAGSIVMALTRTIISSGLKVAVVPSDYNNALLNQRVAAILPCKGGVSMSYLFAYLSSQAVAKYVSERVNTLMQPNLSIVDLRSMPIPTPSFSQQEKITELIALLTEETHRLESIYRQKLTALDDLKKSLLHQAFIGQL